MKKLLPLGLAGALLFSSPLMAQDRTGVLEALLGSQGPVQGLVQTLTTANFQPLIDGLVSDTGLIRGGVAAPLNNTLSGLLVEFDLGLVFMGLQDTLGVTTNSLAAGLLGGDLLGGQAGGLPILGGLTGGLGSGIPLGAGNESQAGLPLLGQLAGNSGEIPILGVLLQGLSLGSGLGGASFVLPAGGERLSVEELPLPVGELDDVTLTGLLGGATLSGL